MPTGVIFDLYETLVTEYEPHWSPSVPSIAERIGISEEAFSAGWKRVREARMRGVINYPEALQIISRFSGGPKVSSVLLDALDNERRAEKASPFLNIEKEIVDMLATLKERENVRLCLMSNASEEETWAWHNCVIKDYFDSVLFSYETGFMKPEIEIYNLACRALNTQPQNTMFIGDGGADELRGAADAGLQPYWATWFIDRWPKGIRLRFESIAEKFPKIALPRNVCGIIQKIS